MKENRDLYERESLGRFCELQEVVDPIMHPFGDHSSMVTGTSEESNEGES